MNCFVVGVFSVVCLVVNFNSKRLPHFYWMRSQISCLYFASVLIK